MHAGYCPEFQGFGASLGPNHPQGLASSARLNAGLLAITPAISSVEAFGPGLAQTVNDPTASSTFPARKVAIHQLRIQGSARFDASGWRTLVRAGGKKKRLKMNLRGPWELCLVLGLFAPQSQIR